MNPQGIMASLDQCLLALSKGNTELKTLGLKKAQTEKAYSIKKAQEILKLKLEKYPATLIMEVIRGNEEIAELRLQKDIAESAYYTCISAIENLRLEIEVLRTKIAWLRTEFKNS